MANDWKIVRFEEIKAESKNAFSMGPFGSKIKAENFKLQGVPVLKGGNLSGIFINEDSFDYLDENKASELKASTAVRGDIVITHRGTLGQVGIIPHSSKYEKYIASQSQLKLSFNRELVDPNFIYYFLKSPDGQSKLLANKSQVGVPAIAQALTSVKSIEINLPSLVEQKRIADFLINIDYFLLNLMESNQILEMLARTIFKSWFVNFDPVHAKAAGREPEGLSAEIAALFPSEFQESEYGLIPKGWHISTFGDAFDVKGGGTPSTGSPEFWENGTYLWATPKDMSGLTCAVIHETERRITDAGVNKISSKQLPINTVLMSSRAPVGYLAIAKTAISINQGFIAIPPIENFPPSQVYCLLKNSMEEIKGNAGGSTFAEISKSAFKPIKFVNADASVRIKFGEICEPLFDLIHVNSLLISNLTATRDELLPRLISGKIRIEEAEEAIADVMPSAEKQVA